MGWTLPSLIATGNPLPASWITDVVDDLTVLETTIGMYGVGSALDGSSPSTATPTALIQAGTTVVTFTGGTGSISLPQAYPNGLLTFLAFNANNAAGNDLVVSGYIYPTTTLSTLSIFGVHSTTGGGVTGNYQINWIAIGC